MTLSKHFLTIIGAAALTSSAFANTNLIIDFSANLSPNSLGGLGSGQSFFPADAAGYAGQTSMSLTDLSLWTGNLGGAGHATTYIAVYDGDPDTSTLIGMSTNFVDTSSAAGLSNYVELQWTFSGLSLDPNTEYWAVLSNSPTDVNPTNTVGRSLQVFDNSAAPSDAYRGTSIIANRAPHGSSIDLRFMVTFAKGTPGDAYCFGDGTGASCPCSAFGALGQGCANTTGSGAVMTGSGTSSMANDTFQLDIAGVPGDKPGLILRGDNQVAIPAGDGILCTSGGSQRSHVQVTSSGSTTFTNFNGAGFGAVANAGAPTNFQFWYRDPANICSGAGFNFTNAWTVTYTP